LATFLAPVMDRAISTCALMPATRAIPTVLKLPVTSSAPVIVVKYSPTGNDDTAWPSVVCDGGPAPNDCSRACPPGLAAGGSSPDTPRGRSAGTSRAPGGALRAPRGEHLEMLATVPANEHHTGASAGFLPPSGSETHRRGPGHGERLHGSQSAARAFGVAAGTPPKQPAAEEHPGGAGKAGGPRRAGPPWCKSLRPVSF
jgi:hypothetical protein